MCVQYGLNAAELRNGAQGRNRTTDTVIFSHVLVPQVASRVMRHRIRYATDEENSLPRKSQHDRRAGVCPCEERPPPKRVLDEDRRAPLQRPRLPKVNLSSVNSIAPVVTSTL